MAPLILGNPHILKGARRKTVGPLLGGGCSVFRIYGCIGIMEEKMETTAILGTIGMI